MSITQQTDEKCNEENGQQKSFKTSLHKELKNHTGYGENNHYVTQLLFSQNSLLCIARGSDHSSEKVRVLPVLHGLFEVRKYRGKWPVLLPYFTRKKIPPEVRMETEKTCTLPRPFPC